MSTPFTMRLVRPTRLTRIAVVASVSIIVFSAAYLLTRYASLPELLSVRFRPSGFPAGWQYKTYPRVLMPVLVQIALSVTLGAIGVLLLSRGDSGDCGDTSACGHASAQADDRLRARRRRAGVPPSRGFGEPGRSSTRLRTSGGRGPRENVSNEDAPDVKAAAAAAEAVALLTLIWVAFQAYAAVALAAMWQRERAGLGWYGYLEVIGLVLSLVVARRAHAHLGRPPPRPFVPEHWRYGQLYKNPKDPALFVPTRNGRRWTLNFGRPVAAVLIGVILLIGVVAPTAILTLLLR